MSVMLSNERDALDAVGDYEVSPGMSVEVVPWVVNVKTLKKTID